MIAPRWPDRHRRSSHGRRNRLGLEANVANPRLSRNPVYFSMLLLCIGDIADHLAVAEGVVAFDTSFDSDSGTDLALQSGR